MPSSFVSSPSFCIIAPTSYLEHYALQSNSHLALAHVVDTSPQYASFYQEMSQRGDFVIMDCSAFELSESYSPTELIRLGKLCGAQVLVLPDYPFQPAYRTIEAAEQWIPMFKDAGFGTFFVPQSEQGNLEDWVESYMWGANNPDVDCLGMSILGIPNSLPHISVPYARVVMTQLLIDRGIFAYNKHHHYLGLNASPNVELPSLLLMNALDTCDSSNPVWTGINGMKYNTTCDSYLPVSKKYIREVDFAEHMSKKLHIHQAIQYNVDVTLDILVDPHKYL